MNTHRVAVLALDDVIPLDLAIPIDVFSPAPYRTRLCGPTSPVRTTAGFTINPAGGLRLLSRADTVVVPGYRPHNAPLDPAVLAALRRAHVRGARMISICIGAFALAQAGILDGRPAATHWRFTDELAEQYPASDVRAALLCVRTDLGVEDARRFAQELVAAPHREGNQAQFIARPLQTSGVGPIGELCTWAKENLHEQMALEDMAARCAMSPRTLTRHFREATGTTPLQWLLTMRIDEARQLLEATDLSIDEVAERAGFGTGLNLRTHFRRRLDTTPTTYRRNFRAPADAARHEAV